MSCAARFASVLLALLSSAAVPTPAADSGPLPPPPSWVWFEAETPSGTPANDASLSGGALAWVPPGGSLVRPIDIPAPGVYHLWVRKFWNPQRFRWQVGAEDSWKETGELRLDDLQVLGGDASRRVGWAHVDAVDLRAGRRTFRLEVPADEQNTTAYDCFLLTTGDFSPRGPLPPDRRPEPGRPGWFAFEPGTDRFAGSPLDLRSLNEKAAGDGGRVRVRDEDFVHEHTGEPVRFWGVNVGIGFLGSNRRSTRATDFGAFARTLASRGVNLVRVHGAIYATSGPDLGRLDTNRVERLQAFVAAMKREGIYTALSIYFPLWVTPGPDHPLFPGYRDRQNPFALLYFHPEFRRLYREWWRGLLTAPNPHGGIPLKDEPAVAFAEMINEDSTLFWTFNPAEGAKGNLPDPQRELLQRQFVDWLRERYPGKSVPEILAGPWQGTPARHDDPAAGVVGFRPLWEMVNQRTPRDQDTARFLTELMRRFHRETYDFLKQDLGFGGLVYASNWKTASARFLDPLDKYANGVGDFFDRHGYFEGPHQGPNAAWNLEPKQRYDDRSALLLRRADGSGDDFDNPVFDLVYNHRPSIITEINWPLPNRHRADMMLVGAGYGALQGTDALCWFAADAPAWDALPGKFSIQTPVVFGQFPGAALAYRRGLFRTGARIAQARVRVDDLFALKGTPFTAPQNFDNLRRPDAAGGAASTNAPGVDPLAFLVGRVGVDLVEAGPAASEVRDLSPFLDRPRRRARSETGELEWNWESGLLTLRAPAAQGIVGFLSRAGRCELPDLTIESPLEYGAIFVVALDEKPLGTSGRILIQVASEEEPDQWATEPATGLRTLTHRGSAPLLVREFRGMLRFKRGDAGGLNVQPLDFHGRPAGESVASGQHLQLLPRTPYYLVERR